MGCYWFNRTTKEILNVELNNNDSPIADTLGEVTWENGTELQYVPLGKMDHKTSEVKEGYQHLFLTPIDSVFVTLPFFFWEITSVEINQYATQYTKQNNTKLVVGYKWKAVLVNEVITLFYDSTYERPSFITYFIYQRKLINTSRTSQRYNHSTN